MYVCVYVYIYIYIYRERERCVLLYYFITHRGLGRAAPDLLLEPPRGLPLVEALPAVEERPLDEVGDQRVGEDDHQPGRRAAAQTRSEPREPGVLLLELLVVEALLVVVGGELPTEELALHLVGAATAAQGRRVRRRLEDYLSLVRSAQVRAYDDRA